MNDVIETIKMMRAVTLSREYGSGGDEIASRLAKRLGWHLIDHDIVARVARAMGTSQEKAAAHDEQPEGILTRLLNSLQYVDPAFVCYTPSEPNPSDELYYAALEKIIRAAAAQGSVVIVGRGSQILLAERQDVLRIRIIAPFEQRVAYVMQREGLDQQAAAVRIRAKDHDRTKFLETEFHRKPDDAHLYDLVLNMSSLDPVSAVNIICLTLNHKARWLCAQTGEQGPTTGFSRFCLACSHALFFRLT
jgi:cytidylate kinase